MIDKTNETSSATELMNACQRSDVALVKTLLEKKPNLHARVYTGDTALHFAAMGGNIEIVKMLLAAGMELTECNYCGGNILHTAASYGQCDLIRYLLDNKYFGVNCPECAGEPVVVWEHDVELFLDKDCRTALHKAVYSGSISAAKVLLEYGADINSTDAKGKSPLHLAVEEGHEEMIGLLLKCGADINLADKNGWTPSAQALFGLKGYGYFDSFENKRQIKIFNFLRQQGAAMGEDVMLAAASQGGVAREQLRELLESHQYTSCALNKALVMAADFSPSYPEVSIKILLKHGALPVEHVKGMKYNGLQRAAINLILSGELKSNKKGIKYNALQCAVINGSISAARLLINAGANVNIKDSSGSSLVIYAARCHQLRMLKCLVSEFKLPCDEINKKGVSPLLGVAEEKAYGDSTAKVIEFLISCGADVNRRNANGQTALHLACANGATKIVRILLAHGADKNLTDKDGKTPVDLTNAESIKKLLGE